MQKSKAINRWIRENAEQHGNFCVHAGFEKAIRAHSQSLASTYDTLSISNKLDLYSFVTNLLQQEHEE